jgi:hypothetical protein
MDIVNRHLMNNFRTGRLAGITIVGLRPEIRCIDGFTMSVQASKGHYCSPRLDLPYGFTSVEVGYPSEAEELLLPFADGDSGVYGWVPVEVVEQVIEKHGGLEVTT